MSAVGHKLILASAGTGKTYRLTNQFLGLLFRGVAPDRILATTFTRKAAGEILDRVLGRLVEGAEDETQCRELAKALELPELRPKDCLELLASLTKDIDSFCVRTIDAFFLGMVQLFALDLGLPPNWSIAGARLDNRLQSDALQDALKTSSTEELLALLRELKKGSVSRSVHQFMLERASKLRPIYLESAEAAWNWLVPTDDVTDDDFDAALNAFGSAELPVTKAGAPNKNFEKAWLKLEHVARAGDWAELFKNGLCSKVMEGETKYSRVEIPEDCLAVIEPLLQRASNRWLTNLVTRNRATYDLLDRFENAYEERKLGYGAYQFTDLPLALAPRSAKQSPLDERELDMWFRMDGRVDHLLLDEFQDTSPIQWRILENIASEIVSDGTGDRSFFCVGDVKQSIYGFRQAEPRLLANLHNMLPPGLVPEPMDKSYRSSQTVLDMVNLVFADIENNGALQNAKLAAYRRAGKQWQGGFDTHSASSVKPGAAFLFEARTSVETDSAFDTLLDLTVDRVVALSEEAPQVEIGVLLRIRKFIPTLILRLKQRGISASGEGGNELVDSSAVLAYIALLHLADHPDDSAAAFHVASSRIGSYVGLSESADLKARREFARSFRRRLTNEGLGQVTADLALQVADDDSWSDWDQTRFAQLLEQAFAFEPEMGLRPSDFVDHLRKERVEAPGGARVRVMTIHASKGLEFECVLLPDLERKIVGQRDQIVTHRPRPDGLIEAVSIEPSKDHMKVSADLNDLYDKATERMVGDGLSNMYVAMTRAANRLELLIANRADRGNGIIPTMADFVLAALPADEVADVGTEGPIWSHSSNSADWARPIDRATASADSNEVPHGIGLAKSTELRSLPRRSPSSEEGGVLIEANRLLAPGQGSRRGSLVHGWLEKLEWVEDFVVDREQMLERGKSIEPNVALREEAFADLLKAIEFPEIHHALSRDEFTTQDVDRLSVQNEVRFSLVLPEEADGQAGDSGSGVSPLWTGSIDRLVLSYRGDDVVGATILDYKTDRVGEAGLAESVEYYRPQLESYARVVAAQTGLPQTAIRKQLLFLTPGRKVDVV